MQQYYYNNAQMSDYDIKLHSGPTIDYNEMQYKLISSNEKKSKSEKFKERLQEFNDIVTLAEAKEILQKIMPVTREITKFTVGDAQCIIVCKDNLLKITFKTPNEFINYSFA